MRDITPEIAEQCKEEARKIEAEEPDVRYVFIPNYSFEDPKLGKMTFSQVMDFLVDNDRLLYYDSYHKEAKTPAELVRYAHEKICNPVRGVTMLYRKPQGYVKVYDVADSAARNSQIARQKFRGELDSVMSELNSRMWKLGSGGGLDVLLRGVYRDEYFKEVHERYGKWAEGGEFNATRSIDLGSNIMNGGYDETELRNHAKRLGELYEKRLQTAVAGLTLLGHALDIHVVNKYYPVFVRPDYSDDGDDSYSSVILVNIKVKVNK